MGLFLTQSTHNKQIYKARLYILQNNGGKYSISFAFYIKQTACVSFITVSKESSKKFLGFKLIWK